MEGKEEEKVEGKEMEEDWGRVWGREGKRLSLSDLMSPLCLERDGEPSQWLPHHFPPSRRRALA